MVLGSIIFFFLGLGLYLIILTCGEAEKLIEKQHKEKKNKEGGK